MSSVGSEAGSEESHPNRCGEVVKTGVLKKLKTMKKKFFLLRGCSPNFPASLEYYDNEKKWNNKHPPKRSITLRDCFSINRRTDTKHKYVIALFTGIECFGIVFEKEDEFQDWLRLLLTYHREGEDVSDGISLKPYYEHVWKVTVQKRELASKNNMSGIYLICLTDSTLSLVKPAKEEDQEPKIHELTLQSIRRYGALDTLFYMELGQASCLGSGNFWMQADDSNIAQHMYSVIREACKNCPKKDYPPKCRSRSSSANEASKPANFGRNKWPSSGDDSLSFLSCSKSQIHQEHLITSPNSTSHSVSSMGDGIHHYNPNLTTTSFSPYPPTRRASTGTRPVTTGPALLSSGRTNTSYTGRERCDSLPTRPRMTLDALSCVKNANLAFYTGGRPCSMYNRTIFSPSGLSHPTSPTSATYSTDSAGSSLSVDVDNETWCEMDNSRQVILEENAEEYVQWGGNPNRIFLSEHIPQSNSTAIPGSLKSSVCQHSSSNSQSSCSPCSSSPLDAGAYLPMSPIESVADNRIRQPLNRSYDSMNHSRESSIHDDVSEGYVPMAPLSADAGYVSMDQSMNRQGDLSPGLSSCSITSGTPSTDCRLSEFHLDKVSSYLTPSDDDIIVVRQTRAYSTGSKPDAPHNKSIRWDSLEGMRSRAFSVGSRCTPNISSASRRTPNSTSTSSIEPCDDLMEIDFSANKLRRRHLHQRYKQQAAAKMNNSIEKPLTPYSMNDVYMDMSPKSSPKLESINDSRVMSDVSLSPPRLSKHLIGRSPPLNINFTKQAYAKNSPVTTSGVLEKVVETEFQSSKHSVDDSYMDMKPGVCDMFPSQPKAIPVIATATNLHARKENFTISDSANMRTLNVPHIKQPLLETDGKQFKQSSTTVDGYIDMSFKGRRNENQAATPVVKMTDKTPDGYVDMSYNKNSRKNLVDSNSSCKKTTENRSSPCCYGKENQVDTRQSSKPIAIQPAKNKRSQASNFFRRYKSEETQPTKPNFLPLGFNIPATFSLGRKKKLSQKKEKSESPVEQGPVTTIFPLSPDHSSPSFGHDSNSKYAVPSSKESIRLPTEYHSLGHVDERESWDCRRDTAETEEFEDEENAEYIVMTPGVMPKLHRKISEPLCMRHTGKIESLAKETKESINKSLQRSTSVPSTMCGMRGWQKLPASSEFGEEKNGAKCRSDSAMNDVPEHQPSVEVDQSVTCATVLPNKMDNVPSTSNSSPCTNTLRERGKVMYATLDIPPSEEVSKKSEESVSLNKPSDQSNLTYAQIDFEKSSRSSSPSK